METEEHFSLVESNIWRVFAIRPNCGAVSRRRSRSEGRACGANRRSLSTAAALLKHERQGWPAGLLSRRHLLRAIGARLLRRSRPSSSTTMFLLWRHNPEPARRKKLPIRFYWNLPKFCQNLFLKFITPLVWQVMYVRNVGNMKRIRKQNNFEIVKRFKM